MIFLARNSGAPKRCIIPTTAPQGNFFRLQDCRLRGIHPFSDNPAAEKLFPARQKTIRKKQLYLPNLRAPCFDQSDDSMSTIPAEKTCIVSIDRFVKIKIKKIS